MVDWGGTASIMVCPDKSCEKSLPVYAGESYMVLLDPGISWEVPFELRIIDPDSKQVGGAVNDSYYLNQVAKAGFEYPKIVETNDRKHPVKFILNPKYTRTGTHTIEIRSKLDDSSDTNGSGLFGSPGSLEFAGDWQPVGSYEVLPAIIHFKGFIAEPFAALKGKGGDFPANTDLEMSTLESRFSDPLVDIIINGSWNRRDCAGNPVLEKNESRIKISFPEQIDLVRTKEIKDSMGGPPNLNKAAQFSFLSGGLPFELSVHIISQKRGKARFEGCNDIDDAAFDIFFKGLYSLKTDPLKFMTDFKRNWLSLGSSNLKFKHPNPVDPFNLYGPIHNYVRGPDTNIILKAKSLLSEDTIGESIRSGNLFFIPVSFNIAMWKIPKRDARDKFIGNPLMGYAVYGAEPGEYTGPVPAVIGTPKNLADHDGTQNDGTQNDGTGTDVDGSGTSGTGGQIQTPSGTKVTGTDQSRTPVQGEDLISPDSDIKSKEPDLDPDKQSPKGSLLVPNLIGKPAMEAKKILSDKGFKVALQAGKAAPSPQKAFTVTNMTPKSGSFLKKGKTVKITVSVAYAQQIKIPDISGLSTVKAKKKLQDAGFKVKLKTKGNSPSPDGAFKTIGTNSPKAKAAKGSTITLISFGPYKDQVTMPSLVGLKVNEAERVLEKLGLEKNFFRDKQAPKKEMEDIVTFQEPKAGTVVSPRTRIKLKYYDDYKWKGKMPDLSGLTVAQAKEKMKETGIDVRVLSGTPSPSGRLVNKIYKQSLAKNSTVKQGDTLMVTLYGKTKDQYVAATDCTGLPGTESFWNTKTGKPVCRCKGGYVIRNDKSGCDKKAKPEPPQVIVKETIKIPPVQPKKYPGGAVILSSSACDRIKKPGIRLDKATRDKTKKEIQTVFGNLFKPVFTSIFGTRGQDPIKMQVFVKSRNSDKRRVNSVYVRAIYHTTPKDPHTQEVVESIFFFNDIDPSAAKYDVAYRIKTIKGYRGEIEKSFDGISVYGHPDRLTWTWASPDKRMYTVVRGLNKNKDYWTVARKVHEQLRTRGLYDIRSKLSCQNIRQVPPPVSLKKNNSTCDQYYRELNQLIGQQQQLSRELMSNPGSTSDYACKALKLARETILVAKKARPSGCKIDGNIEKSSKLLMQTYRQMCRGGTVKPDNSSNKKVPYIDIPSTLFSYRFDGNNVYVGGQRSGFKGGRLQRPVKGFLTKGTRKIVINYDPPWDKASKTTQLLKIRANWIELGDVKGGVVSSRSDWCSSVDTDIKVTRESRYDFMISLKGYNRKAVEVKIRGRMRPTLLNSNTIAEAKRLIRQVYLQIEPYAAKYP
ncbi:MAG: PASTA domain-containing protein [Desulfobacula sp.]|nr:PASTA domain-containing protein [Desulfobacula sp.]